MRRLSFILFFETPLKPAQGPRRQLVKCCFLAGWQEVRPLGRLERGLEKMERNPLPIA